MWSFRLIANILHRYLQKKKIKKLPDSHKQKISFKGALRSFGGEIITRREKRIFTDRLLKQTKQTDSLLCHGRTNKLSSRDDTVSHRFYFVYIWRTLPRSYTQTVTFSASGSSLFVQLWSKKQYFCLYYYLVNTVNDTVSLHVLGKFRFSC